MGSRSASAGLILSALFGVPALAADCAADKVELRGPSGSVSRFHVEVADTPDERAQGLMFRDSMAKSAGMLFVYEKPQPATFWMKNTLIPLDMIFIDETGTVTRVHAKAKPEDETLIEGGKDVRFVLEINGGLAAPLGISEGAVLRSPFVPQATAAWPCTAP